LHPGIWLTLLTGSAIKNQLAKNEKAILTIRDSGKFSYFALVLYSLCAILAAWFPLPIAIITTLTWIFWLIWGIGIKHE
jgi:hypothetical protein